MVGFFFHLRDCEGNRDLQQIELTNEYTIDIDIISTSSIHQSTKHVDFSLKIDLRV